MARSHLIRTSDFPYHVHIRSNNKEYFYLPIEKVWEIFIYLLEETSIRYNLDIYCFTLMNNHYHMLLKTPDLNIDKAFHYLNHKMSLAIGKQANRINRIFGTRYKWSIVKTENYLYRVYQYIYQNPLRANICTRIENYPYNSLNPNLLSNKMQIADTFDKIDFFSMVDYSMVNYNRQKQQTDRDRMLFILNWLNENQSDDYCLQTKKGLKKNFFDPVFERDY